MRTILLPIKPQYVNKIFSKEKIVEYRRWIPSCNVPFKVIIYSSYPVKKIVGDFVVNSIISGSPDELWEVTKSQGGIQESDFRQYFNNTDLAFAFVISNLNRYEHTIDLKTLGVTSVPQRFCYIKGL